VTLSSKESFNKRIPKKLTVKEAKIRAASFCAYQERYQEEVRQKLYTYGLKPSEVEELLSYLISEGFVNEERFAKAFSGGRFRMKKWGKVRIEKELSRRKISSYCIKKGLAEIDEEDYLETLHSLINNKIESISNPNPLMVKSLVADYIVRKGFESVLVWDILNDKIST
jgi:regulatory protein